MCIRPATHADLAAMTELLEQLFGIETEFAVDKAKQMRGLALLLETPKAVVLVADVGGKVVGMVTMQTVVSTAEGGPVGWVEDLVVDEAWRGKGIGSSLLRAILGLAFARGLSRVQLLADAENAAALLFYHRHGLRRTRMVCVRAVP